MTGSLNTIELLRNNVGDICRGIGRDPSMVTIVAVSKTRSVTDIVSAHGEGLLNFGENRVEEFAAKRKNLAEMHPSVSEEVVWHFIGHLQSKKAKHVVGAADFIDSVDSLHLAEVISRRAERLEVEQNILVQVNISGEDQKYGFPLEDSEDALHRIASLPNLNLCGLMGMAAFTKDENVIRRQFSTLKELFDAQAARGTLPNWQYLSMGMSGDYELALREGSNQIRVGSAIFGPRP